MIYNIQANEVTPLMAVEIEANSFEEAKEKYYEMWANGEIVGTETTLEDYQVDGIK